MSYNEWHPLICCHPTQYCRYIKWMGPFFEVFIISQLLSEPYYVWASLIKANLLTLIKQSYIYKICRKVDFRDLSNIRGVLNMELLACLESLDLYLSIQNSIQNKFIAILHKAYTCINKLTTMIMSDNKNTQFNWKLGWKISYTIYKFVHKHGKIEKNTLFWWLICLMMSQCAWELQARWTALCDETTIDCFMKSCSLAMEVLMVISSRFAIKCLKNLRSVRIHSKSLVPSFPVLANVLCSALFQENSQFVLLIKQDLSLYMLQI